MCYKLIHNYSCGHKESHSIPCESLLDGNNCNAQPDVCKDQANDVAEICQECKAEKEQKDDEAAFEEAMRKIAEDVKLAPVPKTAAQPAGDFGFFKQRTKWTLCGHYDSPRELDIKRVSDEEPIWIDTPERGQCHGCSQTPNSILAAMRENGELDGDDPWGAMGKPTAVAAGGSGSNAQVQAHDFGGDLGKHPGLQAYDEEESYKIVSRPVSPDQLPTITKGKGKGRVGKPEETYESRYGPAEVAEHESDHEAPEYSGNEEDDEVGPRKHKATEHESDEDESESESEISDNEKDRRGRRLVQYDAREGSRARSSSSHYSQGDDNVPNWQGPPPRGPPAGKPILGKKLRTG